MRSMVLVAVASLSLVGASAIAFPVRDWHDLADVHNHVKESIREMERARMANHYDMAGHGARAEQLLREAEGELHAAIESSKHMR